MRTNKTFMIALAVIIASALSLTAETQEKRFYGSLSFGYRAVETNGADFKYKEDINLEKGIRLFNLDLHYIADEKLKKLFDRIDLSLSNYGGDPFETFRLSARKYGKYTFQYDRKKSAYFYHDLHEVGAGAPYDYHSLDFERISDSGAFKYWLSRNLSFYVNFDKFAKTGTSITTLDINRIEFEFDRPVKENLREISVGTELRLKRYSFILEQKIQDYENANSLFLPGYADGGPKAYYPSSLSLFTLNQPYDLKTNTQTLKFSARPFDSLLLGGSARLGKQEMDLAYSEEADGFDYLGRIFKYSQSGRGDFNRKINLYDFDLSYLVFKNLAVVGAVRYHEFLQDGFLRVDGKENIPSDIDYNTLGIEAGLQAQFSPRLTLTLGYRKETRKLEGINNISEDRVTEPFETATYEEKTERIGIFGNLKFDLIRPLQLTLDYQRGDFDDPLTIISPTSFDRFRMTAKLRAGKFSATGSYLLNKSESEVFENSWKFSRSQFNLRLGFHTERIKVFAGYSLINTSQEGNRAIAFGPSWTGPAGTFPWNILYEGKSGLWDISLSYELNKNWKIAGYANKYVNKGSWRILRTIVRGYLEHTFSNGLNAQLGYRFTDFKEKSSGYNDYSANIFEFSFGYRWD